jgi:hypothetical protein
MRRKHPVCNGSTIEMTLSVVIFVLADCVPLRNPQKIHDPPCGNLPIVFSPRDNGKMGASHIGAVRAARLFNPNNQIVVVLSNRSGMLTAERTGWVKNYGAVLLTMESLEAIAFTAADWRGIIHLQDLWPSVHSKQKGKRRPQLGYYTRYAYLAAAWRTLRLDSALHIELDVILTATLSELCAATGWPDAYGRARLDATAAMHVIVKKNSAEMCPAPASYGSVHASFMSAEYVAAYWQEVIRYNYLRKGADSGGDMRITGVLREKGMCTAATLTHSLPPSACRVSKTCLRGLLAQNIIIPACAYAEWNLTQVEGDAIPRGANLMPYYAPPEEPMTIRIVHRNRGIATIKSRVLIMATPNGLPDESNRRAHGRALYLHFHANAKRRTLDFLKCFFHESRCQPNFVSAMTTRKHERT